MNENPYPAGFAKVRLPAGQSGEASIERKTLTDADVSLENLRCQMRGQLRRVTPPGDYTVLKVRGAVMMSDVPSEAREHLGPLWAVKEGASVLLNGLGLGFVLAAILRKNPACVTVIEKDADVIALVAPHYKDRRVTIVHADAFDYQPPKGARYDVVWHDIWADICGDNLREMTALKRKYGRRAEWQGCWSESQLRRAA